VCPGQGQPQVQDGGQDLVGKSECGWAPGSWGVGPGCVVAGGTVPAELLKAFVGVSRTPLGWSVDSEDWKPRGADVIVSTIEAQLRPGAVVLLHDGGGDRRQTLDALRTLIPRLQRQGWRFDFPAVTVAPAPIVASSAVASPSTLPPSPALESTPLPESTRNER
jgi:hypothetical protein